MISAALSPTCSTGPHERSEPAHHLRASLVNIVATEPGVRRRFPRRRTSSAQEPRAGPVGGYRRSAGEPLSAFGTRLAAPIQRDEIQQRNRVCRTAIVTAVVAVGIRMPARAKPARVKTAAADSDAAGMAAAPRASTGKVPRETIKETAVTDAVMALKVELRMAHSFSKSGRIDGPPERTYPSASDRSLVTDHHFTHLTP
jgi:hypothetical protein